MGQETDELVAGDADAEKCIKGLIEDYRCEKFSRYHAVVGKENVFLISILIWEILNIYELA